MIALSGYGATGPESEFVSYGPAQVPLSGMSSLTGYADWPPMHVGISYGDPTGGLHGAVAVLAALLHRAAPARASTSICRSRRPASPCSARASSSRRISGTQPPRDGNRDPHMAPHGVFRCAGEQRWVAIAVRDDDEWRRLRRVHGHARRSPATRASPPLAARKANEDALEALVDGMDAIAAPPRRSPSALQRARHSRRRVDDEPGHRRGSRIWRRSGFFVQLPHPEVGTRLHLGIPWRMSETPCTVRRAAPCLGEHTDDVLRASSATTPERIAALRERGVLL